VLVLAECRHGKPTALTRELLARARRLADDDSGETGAVVVGDGVCAQELIAHGADEVHTVTVHASAHSDVEIRAAALAAVSRQAAPELVLIGHDARGADVAPRVAFRLATGVAMGCVDIARQDARVLCTRARQGGVAREVLSFRTAPAVATLRAGCGEPALRDARRTGRLLGVECNEIVPRTRVIARHEEEDPGTLRLEDAKVVVAGGRGLAGPEGFRVLEALAHALGGAVGASRVPCDLGWCPRSWQIGLTGKTVTPDLYIAVGISGAGHHLAGCGNAKAIVAINTDAGAAIFREARYGIVGDYRQVIPALLEALRQPAMSSSEGQAGDAGVRA
jgi:electron transfer flavoprotein alpha subunit